MRIANVDTTSQTVGTAVRTRLALACAPVPLTTASRSRVSVASRAREAIVVGERSGDSNPVAFGPRPRSSCPIGKRVGYFFFLRPAAKVFAALVSFFSRVRGF